MLISYVLGQTSIVLRVKLRQDTTGTSPGKGMTGLTSASTGLVIGTIADNEATTTTYTVAASHVQTITTLGTYAAPSASNCRFKEVDATNHPGVYEIQLADARYAVTSAKSLLISIGGVSGLMDCDVCVAHTSTNPYDAVRGGLTALPNAAANATGGLAATVARGGTAQGGTTSTIKLDSGASATNNIYNGMLCYIVSGAGAGQARVVKSYVGSTKQATVDWNWTTSPSNTSVFVLLAADAPVLNSSLAVTAAVSKVVVRSGTAQVGGASNTIKLDSGASTTNSLYNGDLITITGGTGVGQTRTIVAYVGSTLIATVDKNWNTIPDATSTFDIYASTTPTVFSAQGVVVAATASTVTLDDNASTTSSIYVGSIITILSGTDAGDTHEITAYDGTTKIATISGTFAVTPDTTSAYAVIPTDSGSGTTGGGGTPNVNVISWASTAVNVDASGLPKVDVENIRGTASAGAAGYVGIDWSHINAPTTTVSLANTSIAAVLGSVNSVNGAVTVGTISANTITAASIAAAALNGKGDWLLAASYTTPPTGAAIATAVWQDTTAGDFTVAGSIGKSLFTSGNAPGAAAGIALVGSNMGAVTSVTGSVGSISGVSFPANFPILGITAAGKISEVVLCDTLTTYTGNTPQTGDTFTLIGTAGAGLTALGDTRFAHLDADVSSRAPSATALSTVTWTGARAGYLDNLNTGVKLSATGLDAIPVTDPAAVATTFPQMMVQLWRRFFKRVTKDGGTIKTYKDDGTTVETTQNYTTGGTDDVGAAS